MKYLGAVVFVLSCFAISACKSGDTTGARLNVRDSAGVRIVEVVPAVWPPPEAWRLSEEPVVTIGVESGNPDYELNAVRGAIGLPDGGTLVAEFYARLRYYDANGVHVRTLDLRGEGPGEAGAFSGFTRFRGDSLLLTTLKSYASVGNSRTTFLILAGDGTYGRNVAVAYPGGGVPSDDMAWINDATGGMEATLDDGSFAVRGATHVRLGGPVGGLLYGTAALMRVGAQGELIDTIGEFVASAWSYRPEERRKYSFITGGPEGVAVRARGNLVFHAESERVQLDILEATRLQPATGKPDRQVESDPSARLVRSIRVAAPPIPFDAETRRAYIADLVTVYSHSDSESERQAYAARLDSFPSPATQSAVQNLVIDGSGNVWLELYSSPGLRDRTQARARAIAVERGPSTWVVLTPDGELRGSVLIPEQFEVFEIGDDYVLGLWRDELGVEFVRRYRLIK